MAISKKREVPRSAAEMESRHRSDAEGVTIINRTTNTAKSATVSEPAKKRK